MRPRTPNRGAADDRAHIKAHVLECQRLNGCATIDGDKLIAWIDGMAKRNAARKGGLGRKKKA